MLVRSDGSSGRSKFVPVFGLEQLGCAGAGARP
jgi:hypothetical protein